MSKVILNDNLSNDSLDYWTGTVEVDVVSVPFYATPDHILIGAEKYEWPNDISSVIDAVAFCANSTDIKT